MNSLECNKAVFVGAGKIASSLLPAIIRAGIEVVQVISTSIKSAKDLAEKNNVPGYSNHLSELDDNADIIILSVPDSQIKPVSEKIACLNITFDTKLFIHLSGAKNIYELEALKQKNAGAASFHIMQAFPEREEIDIAGCTSAIETEDERVYSLLSKLAEKMALKPFPIKPEAKVYYHMMGVFALNFMSANFYNSDVLSGKAGRGVPEAKDIVLKAAYNALQNIGKKGAAEALSGPVERGDITTIKEHIEAIKDDYPLLLHYISSSLTLVDVALEKRSITKEKGDELSIYLKTELERVCNNYIDS